MPAVMTLASVRCRPVASWLNSVQLALVVLVATAATGAERLDGSYFWKTIAPGASHETFLLNEDTVVCYSRAAAPADFVVLVRSGDSFAASRVPVPDFPQELRKSAKSERRSVVGNVSAGVEGRNVWIAWNQVVGGVTRIHALRVAPGGDAIHYEIKAFPPYKPVFNLRMHVLDDGSLLLFYVHHSEEYFSPVSDTGDIAKIWATRWRQGKIEFDRQLSASGRVENHDYQVRKAGPGSFDLAWTEDRRGIFGYRHRLGTGRLVLAPGGPAFDEVAHVSPLTSEEGREVALMTLRPLAADAKGNSRPVISMNLRSDAPLGTVKSSPHYRVFEMNGNPVQDFEPPRRADAVSFDEKSRLWRYVDRPLYQGTQPASGEFQVRWTDFAGRESAGKFAFPRDRALHVLQPPGDCFYWLEGEGDKIKLRKVCRPS